MTAASSTSLSMIIVTSLRAAQCRPLLDYTDYSGSASCACMQYTYAIDITQMIF